jgi:hypothetical protein
MIVRTNRIAEHLLNLSPDDLHCRYAAAAGRVLDARHALAAAEQEAKQIAEALHRASPSAFLILKRPDQI